MIGHSVGPETMPTWVALAIPVMIGLAWLLAAWLDDRSRGVRRLLVQTRRIDGWHVGIFRNAPFVIFDFGRLRVEVAWRKRRASATVAP